jgi:hypothetical protein
MYVSRQSRNMERSDIVTRHESKTSYEYMDEEHSDEYMDDTTITSTWTRNIVTSTWTIQL